MKMTNLNGFVPNQPPPYLGRRQHFQLDILSCLIRKRVLNVRCILYSLLICLFSVLILGTLMTSNVESVPSRKADTDLNAAQAKVDGKCNCPSPIGTTARDAKHGDEAEKNFPERADSKINLKILPESRNPGLFDDQEKICIIVPFRDRFEELQLFAPHMKEFLQFQNVSYEILVMNQLDLYRFNRASLINVGYYEAFRAGCGYLAMHDVDLLPENPALNYSYPGLGIAYHVASPEYHPRYNYKSFIGGILILTLQDFKRVNGMSNRYWGWGLEDDEFFLRLRDGKVEIQRPQNLDTNRNNTFLHVHDRRMRKRDTLRVGDQKQVSRRRDRASGLDNVRYEILSRVKMRVEPDSPFTILNVRLHCDKTFSPWCEIPANSSPPTPGPRRHN